MSSVVREYSNRKLYLIRSAFTDFNFVFYRMTSHRTLL